MRAWLLWGLLGVASACSKSAPPPGKVVAIENLCNEADQSRVRVTGHLRYRRGLLSFCSSYGGKQTCDLALYAGPEKPPDFDIMRPQKGPEPLQARISVPVGDDPGEMDELPKQFTEADVVLHLPNGAKAGEGGKVVLDGMLSVIPESPNPSGGTLPKSCYVKVEWASAG
jgi:hypothetical protein